jgi:hypothetical protein
MNFKDIYNKDINIYFEQKFLTITHEGRTISIYYKNIPDMFNQILKRIFQIYGV